MRTKEEIDRLVEENIKLVGFVLKKHFTNFRDKFPYMVEDLYQEGCIGLFKAAKKYDGSKGAFSTIATICIKRYMDNFVVRYVNKHYNNNTYSIEKIVYDNGVSNEIKLSNILVSNENTKDVRIELISERAKYSSIKDIEIIIEMIAKGFYQEDIGRKIGISQSRVSRKLKLFGGEIEALEKLMNILYKNKVS